MTANERRLLAALREVQHIADELLVTNGDERPEPDRVLEPGSDGVEQIYSIVSVAMLGGKAKAKRWAKQRRREAQEAVS